MLTLYDNPARAEWAALTERCVRQAAKITGQVETILARIRQGGDRALREITREIEGATPPRSKFPEEVPQGRRKVSEPLN